MNASNNFTVVGFICKDAEVRNFEKSSIARFGGGSLDQNLLWSLIEPLTHWHDVFPVALNIALAVVILQARISSHNPAERLQVRKRGYIPARRSHKPAVLF